VPQVKDLIERWQQLQAQHEGGDRGRGCNSSLCLGCWIEAARKPGIGSNTLSREIKEFEPSDRA
jgi:hypothetical protein